MLVYIYSTTEELQTINITNISRGIYISKTEGYLGMKMECINNRLWSEAEKRGSSLD